MRKDTWTIIGVMVTLVGLLATFMVTGLASIESRLTAMDNRLVAMDGRLHDMNTRISRIEGHLGLPADVEPIRFKTSGPCPTGKSDRMISFMLGAQRKPAARMDGPPFFVCPRAGPV